jgi:hypothetical protein
MVRFFLAGGYVMFLLLAIGIPMLITSIKFARNADPRGLSLVRALTVALTFAALSGIASDIAAVCAFVTRDDAPPQLAQTFLAGLAESLTPAILAGSIAAVSWMLVAVGVRRMPQT